MANWEDATQLISALQGQVRVLTDANNNVYRERNKLVCLLSKVFPASLEDHKLKDGEEWDDDWKKVVFINLPTGQATWHIHKSEEPMFAHLESVGNKWDGHTTEEKYKRVDDCTVANFEYFGPIMPGRY